jgi:hypothetical protein
MEEVESTRTIWNKTFDLQKCKCCGSTMGTAFEHYRAANRIGAEPADLCVDCKRKALTDVMSEVFGL